MGYRYLKPRVVVSVVPSPAALPTNYSCVCAAALAVLTFAAMQVFRDELGTEGKMSILGGFIGSWFFVFVLTVRRERREIACSSTCGCTVLVVSTELSALS